MKLITAVLAAILVTVGLTFAFATGAIGATTPSSHATYALGTAKHCRTSFVKRTERRVETKRVEVHGKWRTVDVTRRVNVHGKWETEKVTQRYVACVYVAPVKLTTTAPVTVTATAPPAPVTVTATIDPSYTLPDIPQAPPVPVTFIYSASDVGASSLPDGELTLNIYTHGSLSSSFGCQTNVSGSDLSTDSATCTVNLLAWGSYDLLTSYSSGVSNVATTGQTDTVDIEPPAPSATSVAETWGSGATISGSVSGSTAALTISGSNFEGATAVNLTDQLGDACSAIVSGSAATCSMSLTGQPSSFTVAYPGGTSTSGTQTYTGWGIAQTQAVTFTWPADSVAIASPSITGSYVLYAATIVYAGWRIYNGNTEVSSGSGAPANPISVPLGDKLLLEFVASGNYPGDANPAGSLSVTSSQTITTTNGYATDGSAGSADCSAITNLGGTAGGWCFVAFPSSGTYPLVVGYASTDTNYASQPDTLSETVNVTS
jgi:hypothetical protein